MIQEWGQQIRKDGVDFVLTIPAVRKALVSYVCDQLRTRSFQGDIHEVWIAEMSSLHPDRKGSMVLASGVS